MLCGQISLSYAFYTTQGWDASARAHVRTPFRYLGNDWTHCAEIWYVVRDQLAWQFTQAQGRVHLHVRTCMSLFRISGTAGNCVEICYLGRGAHCVVYKSWMGYQYLHVRNAGVHGSILLKYSVLFGPLTMRLTQLWVKYICMSTSATAHLVVRTCSPPRVHHPKCVLLVLSPVAKFTLTALHERLSTHTLTFYHPH